MWERLKKYSTEIKQFGAGIVGSTVLAGLVVAYATPLQDGITEYKGVAAAIGGIAICAMTAAASINLSRYVFLIAIPLVFVCAVVWVMLTVRTLGHIEFYNTSIARFVNHIPRPIPEQLAGLPAAERKQFSLAPRRLERATLRIRHHLDRHAFWSRALLVIALCTVAIGFLPKAIKRRPSRDV